MLSTHYNKNGKYPINLCNLNNHTLSYYLVKFWAKTVNRSYFKYGSENIQQVKRYHIENALSI